MEQTTETNYKEPTFRLNIKESAKKEKYYEFTIRADNIEDLATLTSQIKKLAEDTCATNPEVSLV